MNNINSINRVKIGDLVSNALNIQSVKKICIHPQEANYIEIKNIQKEFSRVIGYCILFKSSSFIEEYMAIKNLNEQKKFIINRILSELKISSINNNNINKVIEYIIINFKKNGYVFHATNSLSAKIKLREGIKAKYTNINLEKELLEIEYIYRKYNPNSRYSPLGYAAEDIINKKNGWFFDGLPIHSTSYANSPQWFNYFCGKSYVYFEKFSEEYRNGYATKNYNKALNVIQWLIKKNNMNSEDKFKIISFFEKNWEKYKNTVPYLIYVPVSDVKINDEIFNKENIFNMDLDVLLEDVIMGAVNRKKNCCCKIAVSEKKLSFTNLSIILK